MWWTQAGGAFAQVKRSRLDATAKTSCRRKNSDFYSDLTLKIESKSVEKAHASDFWQCCSSGTVTEGFIKFFSEEGLTFV